MGRGALLASALVAAAAAAALIAPATAGACPAGKYCTDAGGVYNLTVPPLSGPIYGEYANCEWQVNVTFGDGTSADYVFDGEVGLSGSHTFPHYGEYKVNIWLSGGHRKDNPSVTCPNPPNSVQVLYQSPAEIAQEKEAQELKEKEAKEAQELKAKEAKEAREAKEKAAKEKAAKERAAKEKNSGGPGDSGSPGSAGDGSGPSHPTVRSRNCRHKVYVRFVKCSKGREVIAVAQRKLAHRRAARVAGFSCHLTEEARAISCRRGRGRVLGPLG